MHINFMILIHSSYRQRKYFYNENFQLYGTYSSHSEHVMYTIIVMVYVHHTEW